MKTYHPHPLAILAAIIVQQAAGALWYSPLLFQAAYFAAQGKLAKDVDMSHPLPFIAGVLGSFLATGAISMALADKKVDCKVGGAFIGGMLALLLVVPALVVHELFLGFGAGLAAIDGGATLLNLVLCGFVLGWARERAFGSSNAAAAPAVSGA